jgi:hypothetical protein
MVRENIKVSAKESLAYYELEKYQPRFDEGYSELTYHRNRLNCSGYSFQFKQVGITSTT